MFNIKVLRCTNNNFLTFLQFFCIFLPFLGQEPSDVPGGDSGGGGRGRGGGQGRGGRGGRDGRGGRGGDIGFGGGGRGFGGGRGSGGGRGFGGRGGGFRGQGRWYDNEKETFVLFDAHCSYTPWSIKIQQKLWILQCNILYNL